MILVLFVIVLLLVISHGNNVRSFIQDQFGITSKKVAGVQTSLEKDMKKDMDNYLEDAKKQIMNIKISDLVNSFSKINKVGKDLETAKKLINEQINK